MKRRSNNILAVFLVLIGAMFCFQCVDTSKIPAKIDRMHYYYLDDIDNNGIEDTVTIWNGLMTVPTNPFEFFNADLEESTLEYFGDMKRTVTWNRFRVHTIPYEDAERPPLPTHHIDPQNHSGELYDIMDEYNLREGSDDPDSAYMYFLICSYVHDDYTGHDVYGVSVNGNFKHGSEWYGESMNAIAKQDHINDFSRWREQFRLTVAHECGHCWFMTSHCNQDCIMNANNMGDHFAKEGCYPSGSGHYEDLHDYLP